MKEFEIIDESDLDAALERQIKQQFDWQTIGGEGRIIDFEGQSLWIAQGVFPPGDDTLQLIANLPPIKGKSVLDYGCGTGAIAVSVARNGAERVVAVDLNPAAVSNTIRNAEIWKVEEIIEVMVCDGIPNFDTKTNFDIIVANLPGRNRKAKNMTEAAQWDTAFKAHRSLFKQSKKILNDSGVIVIAKSNYPELNQVIDLAKINGFSCDVRNIETPLPNDPRRSYILEFSHGE